MMKFWLVRVQQRPMLRDGTVLSSSAVTIGTRYCHSANLHVGILVSGANCHCTASQYSARRAN